MATRIRLARGGSKKRPFYRLVIADKRSPRDGKFIEKIGNYNPLLDDKNENRFTFDKERVEYWLKNGATPSEKVAIFLYNNGFKSVESYLPNKYPKSAKEREEIKKKKLEAKKKEEEAKAQQEAKQKEEEKPEQKDEQPADTKPQAEPEAKQEEQAKSEAPATPAAEEKNTEENSK